MRARLEWTPQTAQNVLEYLDRIITLREGERIMSWNKKFLIFEKRLIDFNMISTSLRDASLWRIPSEIFNNHLCFSLFTSCGYDRFVRVNQDLSVQGVWSNAGKYSHPTMPYASWLSVTVLLFHPFPLRSFPVWVIWEKVLFRREGEFFHANAIA